MTHPVEKRDEFLEAVKKYGTLGPAAQSVGIGLRTVERWMHDDKEFAKDVQEARDHALDDIEAALHKRATSGLSDIAGFFLLKRWRPEYRDKQDISIHTGNQYNMNVVLPDDPTERQKIIELAARRLLLPPPEEEEGEPMLEPPFHQVNE